MAVLEKVSLDISVVLGTASMPVHQVLRLGRGAIIELESTEDDEVKILANNMPIAAGQGRGQRQPHRRRSEEDAAARARHARWLRRAGQPRGRGRVGQFPLKRYIICPTEVRQCPWLSR